MTRELKRSLYALNQPSCEDKPVSAWETYFPKRRQAQDSFAEACVAGQDGTPSTSQTKRTRQRPSGSSWLKLHPHSSPIAARVLREEAMASSGCRCSLSLSLRSPRLCERQFFKVLVRCHTVVNLCSTELDSDLVFRFSDLKPLAYSVHPSR